jgi:hypothetical protein
LATRVVCVDGPPRDGALWWRWDFGQLTSGGGTQTEHTQPSPLGYQFVTKFHQFEYDGYLNSRAVRGGLQQHTQRK